MARQRERGATLVLVVVGLAALIAMAGLALDTSHVLLNKSRLQSALDAAALAAAKVLDQSALTSAATTAAGSVFTLNLAQYPELRNQVNGGLKLLTEYSSTLNPFSPGTTPAKFVRTSITGFTTQMSLVTVLGIASINVAGNAVAGPSPPIVTACNIVPVFMCGNPAQPPLYGYQVDQVVGLNHVTGTTSPIGPGNYGLLALGGNGGSIVRTNLAGSYSSCVGEGPNVPTEPGVAAGPVSQGINTRFNIYAAGLSSATFPPDPINTAAHQTSLTTDSSGTGCAPSLPPCIKQGSTVVTTASQLSFNYSNYTSLLRNQSYDTQPLPSPGTAAFGRRILAVPLGDCTGAANGKNAVTVSGFACVFLLQQLPGGSNDTIYGQIISSCDAGGKPGIGGGTTGPHIIELYKSAGSPDS
jgi:Flp pilus assembly protein TadG